MSTYAGWINTLLYLQQVSSDQAPTFDSLDSKELLEVAEVCDRVGKFELANKYYKSCLAKVTDTYQQTLERHSHLLKYIHRNLQNKDLADADRNTLSAIVSGMAARAV